MLLIQLNNWSWRSPRRFVFVDFSHAHVESESQGNGSPSVSFTAEAMVILLDPLHRPLSSLCNLGRRSEFEKAQGMPIKNVVFTALRTVTFDVSFTTFVGRKSAMSTTHSS